MTTGGLYQLIANDGAQDKMLTATGLLRARLDEITRIRKQRPEIKDSTPTLVDIERTHLLFVNAHYKPFVSVGFEYQRLGIQEGRLDFGNQITWSIPQFGDFFNDMVVYMRIEGLTALPGNQVRYCDFPGHRLFANTIFEVNGNFLDQYNSDVYNFHYNFAVSANKRLSWKRCVGQEVPVDGYLVQNPGDDYREVKRIASGPQTFKQAHDVLELWMPLLFWFNLDVGLSIPSVSIPYGQRFIRTTLAPLSSIVQSSPTPNQFIAPKITVADLYINNIFVNPEIHDIFIKRIGFSMIRVHLQQSTSINTAADSLKLDGLKYPVETLYVGARPNINTLSFEDWYRYYNINNRQLAFPVAIPNPVPPPADLLGFNIGTFKEFLPVIDTIEIQAHAVEIYRETPASFFTNYTPLRFGNDNINSPEDIGLHMIPFNLYPGAYQPSGHINLSRSREFYITYTSSVISSALPCSLVVVAVAINFLLIMDGSAALRFNT